jgi:hypothetical protein
VDDEDIRLYLQTLLGVNFPDVNGPYYSPPGDIILERPCIIYSTLQAEPAYASNLPYVVGTRFQVTILSNLPGYGNKRAMFGMPGVIVNSNNSYVAEDIVHDVYIVSINTI